MDRPKKKHIFDFELIFAKLNNEGKETGRVKVFQLPLPNFR